MSSLSRAESKKRPPHPKHTDHAKAVPFLFAQRDKWPGIPTAAAAALAGAVGVVDFLHFLFFLPPLPEMSGSLASLIGYTTPQQGT